MVTEHNGKALILRISQEQQLAFAQHGQYTSTDNCLLVRASRKRFKTPHVCAGPDVLYVGRQKYLLSLQDADRIWYAANHLRICRTLKMKPKVKAFEVTLIPVDK